MMNAVGIDVSKNKSTVTIRRPGDEVVLTPRDIIHTRSAIDDLIKTINNLDGETKVCMECTGRYYEPMASWLSDAGIFVSTVNPLLIKSFGGDSIRHVKTDKADSQKIARFTLDLFHVCSFNVESTPGKGSRFSFRLPKGIRRALSVLLILCAGVTARAQESDGAQDSLLVKAYNYADQTYLCNTEGRFEEALAYADSAFEALNKDYLLHGGSQNMLLSIFDVLVPAETYWLEDGFATDYETILWLRNEIAVSALAMRDWVVYRYNDDAYLKLFKLYFGEWKIEEDCRELQRTNSNLTIAVIVFVLIFLTVLLARYVMHLRHWMKFRSDLQQAIRVVNSISDITAVTDLDNFNADDVVSRLTDGIFMELDHLADMRSFMITLNDEGRMITAVHNDGPADERLSDRVNACLAQGTEQSSADGLCHALPLMMTLDDEQRMIGAVGFRLEHEPDDTWQIIKGMVVNYLATALYSCVRRSR